MTAGPHQQQVRTGIPMGPAVVGSVTITLVTASGGRERNEDAIGLDGWVMHGEDVNPMTVTRRTAAEVPIVVAVVDGMGGLPAGDRAARIAARELTLRKQHRPGSEVSLRAAFQRADDAIRTSAVGADKGMGCTAAMIIVRRDGVAILGNIGDVRIYRRLGQYIGQLTQDDRLDYDGVVSRCLGGRHRVAADPHEHIVRVTPGDQLLLCSDGLYDAVGEEFVAETLVTMGADHAVAELINKAKKLGNDNVTIVLMEIKGVEAGPPPPSPPKPPAQAPPAQDAPARAQRKGFWPFRGGKDHD